MTTLRKVLPLLVLCAALFQVLPLAAQNQDISFTHQFTGDDATWIGVSNLSGNTPSVNWRITFSSTGTLTTQVTIQGSPDRVTWTSVPNTICSATVQPPCIFQGTNPTASDSQGMIYASLYANYVRVITSGSAGAGTATVRGYGVKGASAATLPQGSGGGGGSGTVTNVATSGPITGGPITGAGTIGLDTTKVAQKFFGTAAPGSVATNLPGDLFTDTTAHNEYVCNAPAGTAAPACTSVTAAGWLLLNGGGGGGGTVTNTGTLAANAVILGNGGVDLKPGAVLPADATKYLDGTGAFTVPPGGTLSAITEATAANTIANGDNAQVWNWSEATAGQIGITFGETAAATSTGTPYIAKFLALIGSTATPLNITNSLNGSQALPTLSITPTWNTTGVVDAALFINATNTASGAASKLIDAQVSTSPVFTVDKTGLASAVGGVATGATPPGCVGGTAGALCQGEGTPPTTAAAVGQIYTDSTLHDMAIQANGGAPKLIQSTAPGYIHATAKTAAVTTATLCAASAGACNQPGQYRVDWNFVNNGTACSDVTAGSVTFLLTWTDNAGTHSAVSLPMHNSRSLTATTGSFTFETTKTNAWASGTFNIQSTGAIIQYATGYTACTAGTGTYELNATVTRLQ